MKSFKEFLRESQFANNTQKTQVATTGGTYEKTGAFLKDKLKPHSKIVSIGAGLDHTRDAMHRGLGHSHTIDDMEPNPEKRKNAPEYTKSEQIPHNHYDAAVSHNVLNVVEPHVRDHVMHSIFNSVKPGGHAVIGARKWTGDVAKNKNKTLASEPKAMWVHKGTEHSYQKGFDGDELKSYVEGFAAKHGHKVKVSNLKGISANGVHVHILSKGNRPAS